MIVRCAATFTSDLPDDQIEDESEWGDFIQYGGKSVIEAIADILTRLGCVIEPPEHAFEHGWDMHATYGKRRLWCQVTLMGEYLFLFEDNTFFNSFRKRPHPDYVDILVRLAQELSLDPRFHDVLWFNKEGVMRKGVAGSEEPVSAD